MNTESTQTYLTTIFPDLTAEAEAEWELVLPEYCPNVLRILQATATACVRDITCAGDRLTVEGSAEFQVLYLAEDGQTMRSISQQVPFTCSVEPKHGTEGDLHACVSVQGCTARAVNPRRAYVRSALQIRVRQSRRQTVLPFSPTQDHQTDTAQERGVLLACSGEKTLRISDGWECVERSVSEILRSSVSFCETEKRTLTDKLIVKADMIFDLLCTDENGGVFPIEKTVPVSQIVDLPNLPENGIFVSRFDVTSLTLTVREQSAEMPSQIAYDAEIAVSVRGYTESDILCTRDLYSIRKTVECEQETLLLATILPVDETGELCETVEIGTCSELLRCELVADLRTCTRDAEGSLLCDGVWECRVLMTDAEGSPCSVSREIPFRLCLADTPDAPPIRNDTVLSVTDLTCSLIGSNRMELRATYRWSGVLFGRREVKTVIGAKETGERAPCEETVTLHYAVKGETAWQIAKEHGCDYAEFLRVNGIGAEPLTEDKMLMILHG